MERREGWGKCGKAEPETLPPKEASVRVNGRDGWTVRRGGHMGRRSWRHKFLRDVAETRGSAPQKCAEAVDDGKVQ